jgi:hypothetical protein
MYENMFENIKSHGDVFASNYKEYVVLKDIALNFSSKIKLSGLIVSL